MLMGPNKAKNNVDGCLCSADMAVLMCKVEAIPLSCVHCVNWVILTNCTCILF